jgi:hypothetical protein
MATPLALQALTKDEQYILKYSFIYLNMKKVKDEGVTKIMENEENR